jgi:hypothetical protein
MQIQITPEQRSQIKQAATNLIASVDFGLPAKAITMVSCVSFRPTGINFPRHAGGVGLLYFSSRRA